MPAYDRCPICKKMFNYCPHSTVQVETWLTKNTQNKEVRKIVLDILKEFDLIPKAK